MMNFIAKTAILSAVPKLIDTISDLVTDMFKDGKKGKETRKYKKRDTTKFTKQMYDHVLKAHAEWLAHNLANPTNKILMTDFIAVLNKQLELNKSQTPYVNIWNGKVDREKLPDGVKID